MFKISNDQKREKLRIKSAFVLFINKKTAHGTRGNKIINNNIKKRLDF